MTDFLASYGGRKETGGEKVVPRMIMSCQEHVGQYRHPREKLNILESTADPLPYQFVRGKSRNVATVKGDRALIGSVKARDAIHEARFPRAIRADDGEDFSRMHIKTHVIERRHPAKLKLKARDLKLGPLLLR